VPIRRSSHHTPAFASSRMRVSKNAYNRGSSTQQ
jgi:hypothetical protein